MEIDLQDDQIGEDSPLKAVIMEDVVAGAGRNSNSITEDTPPPTTT